MKPFIWFNFISLIIVFSVLQSLWWMSMLYIFDSIKFYASSLEVCEVNYFVCA